MAESSGLHWPAEAPVHGGTQVDRILSNATDKTLLTTWVNEQGNSALHFERGPTPTPASGKAHHREAFERSGLRVRAVSIALNDRMHGFVPHSACSREWSR